MLSFENQNIEFKAWGGLVYRRDILETMTGGNIAFPSGNDEPTTVEDMDYMLELMKQYAAGVYRRDAAHGVRKRPVSHLLSGKNLPGMAGRPLPRRRGICRRGH